jgi:dihydroorotase
MTGSILIKDGRVIDPGQGIDREVDVLIIDGKISAVSGNLSKNIPRDCEIFNAKGLIVSPGLIDMHCHLRDPGVPEEETIASGTMSAAAGGFTSIACMANTNPVADTPAVIEYILSKAAYEGLVGVMPIAAVTKGLKGEEIAEMGLLLDAGAVAFSDDGHPIMNAEVMRRALEYAKQFNAIIISHCEDLNLSSAGVMNEGYMSTILGLKGIPKAAEESMVERDCALAQEFNAKIHIAHVSTEGSVEIIRRAKDKGIKVTCETAPHYFTLTEGEVEGYNTNAKMNPPLRTEEDVQAIVKGLKDGAIDVIATDHAPHLIEEKKVEFKDAAFGIVGFETALPLVYTELVDTGVLTLSKAIEKLTCNPAKILSKKTGTFKVGYPGNVTIMDLKRSVTVDTRSFLSKSKNSPYDGWKLKGGAIATIVSGRLVMKDGKVLKSNLPKAPLPKFIDINK